MQGRSQVSRSTSDRPWAPAILHAHLFIRKTKAGKNRQRACMVSVGVAPDRLERPRRMSRSTNVNSHDLGVIGLEETEPDAIARSPVAPQHCFAREERPPRSRPAEDNQRTVMVNIVERGDASGNHSNVDGRCVSVGLPRDWPPGARVNVVFGYEEHGRFESSPSNPGARPRAKMEIRPRLRLTDSKNRRVGQKIRTRPSGNIAIDPPRQSCAGVRGDLQRRGRFRFRAIRLGKERVIRRMRVRDLFDWMIFEVGFGRRSSIAERFALGSGRCQRP